LDFFELFIALVFSFCFSVVGEFPVKKEVIISDISGISCFKFVNCSISYKIFKRTTIFVKYLMKANKNQTFFVSGSFINFGKTNIARSGNTIVNTLKLKLLFI